MARPGSKNPDYNENLFPDERSTFMGERSMGPERSHLAREHGFTESEFGMFGDNPSESALAGAHEQEHYYNQGAVDHVHQVFHDRRDEGRRHAPQWSSESRRAMGEWRMQDKEFEAGH
jgi:hypothetical protein